MKKTLALVVVLSSSALLTEEVRTVATITGPALLAPKNLGQLSVLHSKDGFKVLQKGTTHDVQPCWTDKTVRNRTPQQIAAFLKAGGKLSVKKIGDEFKLTAHTPGVGGGPVTGAALYWLTKSLCYGTAAAGATTAVVATGGLAGAASGLGVFGATTLASAGASTTLVTGAGAVTTAITSAGLAEAAAVGTAGVITSAGSIAGAVAAVESASLAALTFGNLLVFLP